MSNLGNKEVLAKNLAYYLNLHNKSQREMCALTGVSTSTFNDWMKAKKYPRIDKIEILANYFGILKSDLIEDKSEDKKSSPDELPLTEGEKILIDLFRRVPSEQQKIVLQMIRAALDSR